MSWLSSLFIAVLTAVVAAVAGGFVAAGCVDWYHISGHEGQSGYTVIAIGLLGGIVGFFFGLVLTRFVGGSGAAGFFKGLAASAGGALALAGAAGLVAWLLADIPPTLNGHALNVVVEIRLPTGAPQPTAGGPAYKSLELMSTNRFTHAYRKGWDGTLQVAKARQVDGRWVIPGTVYLFTTRGDRIISVPTSEHESFGFGLEIPGHPGAKYKQWSEWLPRIVDGKPWPDTERSYRFRIEEIIPVPYLPSEDEFKALTPDAPLEKWLAFLKPGIYASREQAIVNVVEARPADLAKLLRSPNFADFDPAIYAVTQLTVVDPEVVQAMRDIATGIEDQLRTLNAMKPDDPNYYELANDIRYRFKGWSLAWRNVQPKSGVDGRPLLEEILQLAKVQKDNGQMQEVIAEAEFDLSQRPAEK
jgi:hypothetical protein